MSFQKTIVIVGAAGSGKTKRAEEEAGKIGGKFAYAFFNDIKHDLGLRAVLGLGLDVLIVEGLPSVPSEREAFRIKRLISGDPVLCRRPYEKETFLVTPPRLIFTLIGSELPDFYREDPSFYLRFEIIELG